MVYVYIFIIFFFLIWPFTQEYTLFRDVVDW